MSCSGQNSASLVWAVIVGAIVLLIVYAIVKSNLKERKQRKAREKVLPFVDETIKPGQTYNVVLSDGRKLLGVQFVGASDPNSGVSALGGCEGMLVLQLPTGKRAYVRQSAVRFIEEV